MPKTESGWFSKLSGYAYSWFVQPSSEDPLEYENELALSDNRSIATWAISSSLLAGFFSSMFNKNSNPKTLGFTMVLAAAIGGLISWEWSSQNRRVMVNTMSEDISDLLSDIELLKNSLRSELEKNGCSLDIEKVGDIINWANSSQHSEHNQIANNLSTFKLLSKIKAVLDIQLEAAEEYSSDVSKFWAQDNSFIENEFIKAAFPENNPEEDLVGEEESDSSLSPSSSM